VARDTGIQWSYALMFRWGGLKGVSRDSKP